MIIMMIILRITMMIKMTKCIVLWKDKCNSSTGNDQIMTLLLSVHDVSWVVGLVVWLSWLQGWMGWLIELVDADFCMTFHFLSRELLNSLLSSADWIFHWKPRDLNFSSKQELLNFSLNSLQNREVISRRSLEEKNLGKKKKSKKAANVKNAVFVKLRRTKKMKSKKKLLKKKNGENPDELCARDVPTLPCIRLSKDESRERTSWAHLWSSIWFWARK